MEEENNGVVDTSNQQEEEVLETSHEEEIEQGEGESLDEYKARLTKAEELANNYKVRAEKAEKLAKTLRQTPNAEAKVYQGELTAKDTIALMEAKVSSEDIDDVVEYAKFKKISVSEAIKSNVVKTMLAEKTELRQTAQAANVGGSKRSSGKTPDDVLLAKAQKGEFPDNDADLQRLINLKGGYKQ